VSAAVRGGARLLMLGTANHPHVEHLALAMAERDMDVIVGGDLEPSLPQSVLPEAGVPVRVAPGIARRKLRGMRAHVRWIKELLWELEPDVVHAHWMPGFAFFSALAGASPLVAMAWGSDVYRTNRRQDVVNRWTVRRADVVMTDSEDLLERLEQLGAPLSRTVVVNWGVDLATFSPVEGDRSDLKRSLGLDPGPVVLSPRSLAPVYNIPTIVAAFERVSEALPDAQLVIKHMGANGESAPELPGGDRVHVIGHVPYERMAAYYQAADVCVSIASSDSAPRSAWEALACGSPLVVSDLPWVHEQLEHGRTAMIVPIDVEVVGGAMLRILTEAPLAADLRGNGRQLVERRHDRRTQMDRLAAIYERLARRSR
jgi:glycosyltransferase involved in cell wall biosynthesis